MIPDGSWPLHLFWSCGLFQALHSFKGAITLWLAIASLALKLLALCCLSLAHLPTFTVWLEFVAQKCLKHPFGSPEVNGNDGTNGWDGPSKQLDQGLEMFRSQGQFKGSWVSTNFRDRCSTEFEWFRQVPRNLAQVTQMVKFWSNFVALGGSASWFAGLRFMSCLRQLPVSFCMVMSKSGTWFIWVSKSCCSCKLTKQ